MVCQKQNDFETGPTQQLSFHYQDSPLPKQKQQNKRNEAEALYLTVRHCTEN